MSVASEVILESEIIDFNFERKYQNNQSNQSHAKDATSNLTKLSELCPTDEEKKVEIIPNVTVTIQINLETKILLGLPNNQTVRDIRIWVSKYFQISINSFSLLFDKELNVTDETTKLYELKLRNPKKISAYILLNENTADLTQIIEQVKNDVNLPKDNSIFVHVKYLQNNEIITSNIPIEKLNYTKHFLGGFTSKTTGIEYHHVATQTRAPIKKITAQTMKTYSRDTQTYKIRNFSIDNVVTTCTQMTKPGYYVSNITDKIVIPKKYYTADELEAFILTKVIIIQKYVRRWLAKKRVQKLREILQMILNYKLSEKKRKEDDRLKRLKELYEKSISPLYNDDFDLLYNALEKWRIQQLDAIDKTLPISVQKALACEILDQQHEKIVLIDKLKNRAVKILNFRAKKNKLIKVAKSKVWKNKMGEEIAMDFVDTVHGRNLFEVYKSLSFDFFNGEERLDILLTLKKMIKNSTEKAASELISLINREADLIMRNVDLTLLKGLRTRISTLFLSLCRKPSFNPGVIKYLKAPLNPLDLRGTFQLCRICNCYLKNSQFMFSAKSQRLGCCRSCTRLYNHSIPREELSPYRNILNVLRRLEEEYQDYSKLAFVFSEIDMKYLITKIWDSKSILSSNDDLENLTFVRWDNNKEWSPWNTVFLTYYEADAHKLVEDACNYYNKMLIDKIHYKQIMGHYYFQGLIELANDFIVHNKQEELQKYEEAKRESDENFLLEKKKRFVIKKESDQQIKSVQSA